MSFALKSVAVAGVILLATVGGAFAAHLDQNTKLLDAPNKWANVVDFGYAGDHEKVINSGPNYCLVKHDGINVFVKKWAIDFSNGPKKPWNNGPWNNGPYNNGPYGCVYGPYGYVCI